MDTPQSALDSLAVSFASGDVDAAVAHYESGAVYIDEDGSEVRGIDGIRAMLTEFLAMKPQLTMKKDSIVETGDIAVRSHDWGMTATAPDGSTINVEGAGFDVVRKDAAGSWKIVVDNPWGASNLS